MQRAETDACRRAQGGGKGGGGCCRLAVRAHTAMQICQCPLAARVCVQRHVWHAVTFLPLLSAPRPSPHYSLPPLLVVRCLVSSFCFQTGVKETNHLHTAPTSSPPSFPSPPSTPHSQQINGHKAFLPARRWVGAKFTSRRRRGRGTLLELSASPRKL